MLWMSVLRCFPAGVGFFRLHNVAGNVSVLLQEKGKRSVPKALQFSSQCPARQPMSSPSRDIMPTVCVTGISRAAHIPLFRMQHVQGSLVAWNQIRKYRLRLELLPTILDSECQWSGHVKVIRKDDNFLLVEDSKGILVATL